MTILRDSRFEARLFQTKRDSEKEQDSHHFSNSVEFFKKGIGKIMDGKIIF